MNPFFLGSATCEKNQSRIRSIVVVTPGFSFKIGLEGRKELGGKGIGGQGFR